MRFLRRFGVALVAVVLALGAGGGARAKTVQENFAQALRAFMTTAGGPWGLPTRTHLPLLMKNLNDALLVPDLKAERPHVFVAQAAAFVRWLGQADGVQDRSDLAGYTAVKLGQLMAYAKERPEETGEWALVVYLLAREADLRYPGGVFADLKQRAQGLSNTSGGVLRNNAAVAAILRGDGRLTRLDDTLWLDLADTFAANALTGREVIVNLGPSTGPTAAATATAALGQPPGLRPMDTDPGDTSKVLRDYGAPPGQSAPPPVAENPQPQGTDEPPDNAAPPIALGNPPPNQPVPDQPPVNNTPPDTLTPPTLGGAAPGPVAAAQGQAFVVAELGVKVTPPTPGWQRDAQAVAGSVTFLNGPQRFTLQPEVVGDVKAHMDLTVAGLRRVGFEVTFSNLKTDNTGYQLVVSKAPLSQWVELKQVGNQWFLLTATTGSLEFETQRPNLEKMSQSVEAM